MWKDYTKRCEVRIIEPREIAVQHELVKNEIVIQSKEY